MLRLYIGSDKETNIFRVPQRPFNEVPLFKKCLILELGSGFWGHHVPVWATNQFWFVYVYALRCASSFMGGDKAKNIFGVLQRSFKEVSVLKSAYFQERGHDLGE